MYKIIKYSFLIALTILVSCSDIKENSDAISELEDKIELTKQELAILQQLVQTLQEKNEQDIQIIKEAITGLTATVVDLENRLAKLEGDVSDLEEEIQKLKDQIAALEKQLASLESRLDVAEAKIDSLGNQVIVLIGKVDYKFFNINNSDGVTRDKYDNWLVLSSPFIKPNSSVSWAVKSELDDSDWAQFSNVQNPDLVGLSSSGTLPTEYDEENKHNLCYWRFDIDNTGVGQVYWSKWNGSFSYGAFVMNGAVWIDMPCAYQWLTKHSPVQFTTDPSHQSVAQSKYSGEPVYSSYFSAVDQDEYFYVKLTVINAVNQ
jgi:uncharacterized coiled-coil protein SlyX